MEVLTVTVDAWDIVEQYFTPIEQSPHQPAEWVTARLGGHMWSKQRDIADSVAHHRRTAAKACHGPGKSRTAAWLTAWWIDIHPPGTAIVVSTATTYKQVHLVLWEEIRSIHRHAKAAGRPLRGKVLKSDEWQLDDGTVAGFGRKPADTDEHGFQGIHRRYVLAIIDEACGVPEQLWTAVEAITTNADCRILAIGNPDDPGSEFARVCKPGSGWNVITISAFDTPNFTDEQVPADLRPMLVDPEWVEGMKKRYGETSPAYTSKVLGEFPDIGQDTLIAPSLILKAQQAKMEPTTDQRLGVDVARFGSDQTVIYHAQGPVVREVGTYGKQATTETTGHVIDKARGIVGPYRIQVDGVGVGSGVVDQLAEQGYPVIDMQAGSGAIDSDHFLNARAEWYWGLRQLFEDGAIDIDEDDDELAAQLGSIKYKFTSRGQIQIESKDEMRKRGLPSPDRADALMLAKAFIDPDAGRVFTTEDLNPGSEHEFDYAGTY